MTINFRYHVCHLHTKSTPETDTVETVEAYLYGEDENGKNTTKPFSFKPKIPESYSGDFIKYNDLTEAKVISWIESNVAADEIQEYKDSITERITSSYTAAKIGSETTLKSPVPW